MSSDESSVLGKRPKDHLTDEANDKVAPERQYEHLNPAEDDDDDNDVGPMPLAEGAAGGSVAKKKRKGTCQRAVWPLNAQGLTL